MNIETKFTVGDLVKRKFDRSEENQIQVFEIMEVLGQVCYGGTQIFYQCRVIIGHREKSWDPSKKPGPWQIGHGISKEPATLAWNKYSEFELIPCDPETLAIITDK